MPINASPEFFKAQRKYLEARTREEKIVALKEMIKKAPSHKGAKNLRAQLKKKLARLKQQKKAKASRKSLMIPKEGDAQVCILGLTQSGKSTLLSKLTNAKPKISNHPFTTTKPEIGTFDFEGVKIQLIEIPSNFKPVFMSIVQSSDAMILIYRNKDELKKLKDILSDFRINKPFVEIRTNENLEKIKNNIWNILGLLRIYCKEPGKKPEKKALVLKKGSTVEDAAKKVHKDFVKYFKFARIWGKSAKYGGQSFGSDHELEDGDILEIHMG